MSPAPATAPAVEGLAVEPGPAVEARAPEELEHARPAAIAAAGGRSMVAELAERIGLPLAQVRAIVAYLKHGTQATAARKLKVSQQAIAKAMARACAARPELRSLLARRRGRRRVRRLDRPPAEAIG